MRNYRIAFFTVDWNYALVESTLHGLKQFVDDHDNVFLRIFDCFGKDQGNAKDWSEYAIFDLANLSQFDGLLLQGNQIILGSVRDRLAARIAQAGIPAVSIDCPIEGCTMVCVDNRSAQYSIADHVIREHGARRMVYLTGMLNNGSEEGPQRRDGFLDACRDNGIDPSAIELIECTWRTTDGLSVAERWIRENRALPDAFICANDEMALGLIEGLQKNGVAIPDDVIVTGFDNLPSAELSKPRLSTVHRDYARMNYFAMDVLLAKIDGREHSNAIPFGHEVICSESCGCREVSRLDYIRDRYFQQTRLLNNFYKMQEQMAEALFDASDLTELMDIVEQNHSIFGCDDVFLCVNDYYYDNYEKKQWQHDGETFGDEMVLAACGHKGLAADGSHLYDRFPTRDLLPRPLMETERFLIFYPLHYNTYSIGYLAMDGISQAAKLNLHESIFSFLEIAIENVRKKCLLRQLNDMLDDLYVHDALTGLYNRFGYQRFANQAFDAFMARDGGAQVLFVDMDDMKTINDRFGHEVGDAAIRATADILKAACDPRDFLMRYGGDEFLVIASCGETALAERIVRALESGAHSAGLPCRLDLSVGIVRADGADGPNTLEACVQRADSRMYEIKKQKKSGEA